jgi:enoyl-CoA hydratase/carnithine racemase
LSPPDRARRRDAIVTINRPKVLNALNTQTLDELRRAILELKHDDGVRAVVLTGAGEKSFVAGADINELACRRRPAAASTRSPASTCSI